MTAPARERARRAQLATVLHAVMAALALLVALQWVLLSVAVDGFLGARRDVLGAATGASGLCFLAACWLFRRLPGREAASAPARPSRMSAPSIREERYPS